MNYTPSATPDSVRFQRGAGRAPIRKPGKKRALRMVHVLLILGGAALLFLAAYKAYAFVITWPKLAVQDIRVACTDPRVQGLVSAAAATARGGNLILLDMDRVRRDIEAVSWVKEARIRKIFPAALAVEAVPRRPAALVEREAVLLIDDEGRVIESTSREARPDLPLFVDEGRFLGGFKDKIRQAFACLADLAPGIRDRVDVIDVSVPYDLVLRLRGSATRLRLGDDLYGFRTAVYLEGKDRWEREFGELDSVILWLADRIVLQPMHPAADAGSRKTVVKETP